MTIRNVDTMKLMNGIKGQIRRRVIYSRVPGFQLQLHDETGQIQVKFWKDAAKYQNDPRLEEGAVVFLRGYRLVQLKTEQLELAPSGRRHCLCYDSADAVQIELLQGIPEASVAEASAMPVNARLSLRCYVQSVEDRVDDPSSQYKYRRRVWVSDGPNSKETLSWTLWGSVAQQYSAKVLKDMYVLAKNVKVSAFRGQKQLSGCSTLHLSSEKGRAS